MTNPRQTGSFWLCPQCRKHVPTRTDTCSCGFDRRSVPVEMKEVSAAPPRGAEIDTPTRGRGWLVAVVLALALAGASYLSLRAWHTPTGADRSSGAFRLGQRLREGPSPQPTNAVPLVLNLPAIAQGRTGVDPAQLFGNAAPTVVVVVASGSSGERQGGGVVISRGKVVTNKHVVATAAAIQVTSVTGGFSATLAAIDPSHDLALLDVPGLATDPPATRASESLRVGERVYAIGSPKGLALTMSEGLISGLRPYEGGVAIQTSAALSPGSSGGALFDSAGLLIGVTTFAAGGENLNFALPIEWARALATESAPSTMQPILMSGGQQLTEEQRERRRADAIYRPRMQQVANAVRKIRTLRRRYYDACFQRTTVTETGGERTGVGRTSGEGSGASTGSTTVYDERGRAVAEATSTGRDSSSWVSVRNWREQWNQVSVVDNETTPQCRLIASEIADLGPGIGAVMEEAEREAVRQNIWTWLQRDVPEQLAAEMWADTID